MPKVLLTGLLILFSLLTSRSQSCQINSVTATPLTCDGNYFMVSVTLDVTNPASPGFTLAGNGVIYGTYLYDDLPVTVGPFLGDDASTYEFIAWDVENGECQNYTTLAAANCGPICGFSNPELTLIECVSLLSALVTFDVDVVNPTNPAFDLFYENGSEVGSWLYTSLPVTIPFFVVNGAAPIVLTICDNNNPDCCETFSFDAIDCNPNNCEIVNMVADPECTGNNFLVHLDFDYSATPSDSFTLNGNGLDYGTFAYNELPVTVGPLNGNTNIAWEFVVADSGNPNCTNTELLGIYKCPPPCDIQALSADVFECTSESTYALELNIEAEGEGDLGFSVFSESYFYGTHSYEDLPLVLSSIAGTGNFVDQVTICDNDNPGCCETTAYEAFLCSGCVIADLVATPQPCNLEGEFMVELNFYYYNTASDQFEVTGNSTNYGAFFYEDLPVLIGPFPGDGSIYLEFVVTDLEDPLCFDAVEVGEITCQEICELSNLVVETGDCTGDDTYVAHIDFDYQGTTGIGFDMWINGEYYDFFSYTDLPLTIEEFPSSGNGVDVITVCENDNPTCCATLEFAAPDCTCEIVELNVDVQDCTSDSTFAISIEFFSQNTPNNNVDVFLDGVYWGFYNAENLPLVIGNIPEGDDAIQLTVCASDQNDCCASVFFTQIACNTPGCNIWDLFAEIGDCNSDSTYLLDFTFNHNDLPNDSITVTANGQYIGQYIIHPDFNRIENFPVLDNDTVHLVVCAVGTPDCCDDVTFIAPPCDSPIECHIWDLVAEASDCQTDSTFNLQLVFNYTNLPTDSVVITANGNPYGTYPVSNGNILLLNFPEYNTDFTHITICAQGAPDCCDVVEFETPNCGENTECHIWDLVAIVGDCQTDSTYVLHLEFNSSNLPGDSVTITANGNGLGNYAVNGGSIWLEQFPVYLTNHTVVIVCAAGSPDCCDVFEFETPNCEGGGDCHLFDLVADPGDCQSDSTYSLFIHYFGNNFPGDSVIVTANETYIGTFPHNPEGFWLQNFPEFNTDFTHLTVCAAGAPDCCDTYEFLTLNCGEGNECHIYDLVAEAGDCQGDSAFVLFLQYFANNLPADSVIVSANNTYLGQFAYSPDPFSIGNVPLFGTNHIVVTVCAVGAPDCCDVFEFETPDCGQGVNCHFDAIFAETGPCTSDSTYVLDIVINLVNASSDSVLIYANDIFVGQYFNHPDFIHIENFPHLPGEHTTVTVCALGDPECCASYTFDTPFCTSECVIYNIEVDPGECTSDSTFAAIINFDYQNIDAGGFDVYAGTQYLGFFTFEQVPVTTTQFPSNASGQYVVVICESDNTECCAAAEFQGPVCGEGGCHIYDLTYEVTECDSNGHFYFILDFEFNDVGNEGFNIFGNGNSYGNFSYDNVPVTLGPFEQGNTEWEFIVIDGSHPDCSDFVDIGVVDCNVATEPVIPDDYFQVFNNGTIPGILPKKNVSISLFNGNGLEVVHELALTQDMYHEINQVPDGFYILQVRYQQYVWPVKLVKTGR